MPHVDASLKRGNTTRKLCCGAALALCAALVACSSESPDNTDPLDESMGSTGTLGNTTSSSTTTTVSTVASNTAASTSASVSSATTSGGPTTGGFGMTTASTTGAATTGSMSSNGAGGNTGFGSSNSMGPTGSTTGAGGASSTENATSDTTNSTTGTTGGGSCEPDMVPGSEVLMIGESFIAFSHGITHTIEDLAKAAGALGEGESYRDNSISGTTLAGGGNSIPNQYQSGVDQGPVRVVLMDGGGNDCLQANNPSGALSAAEGLFQNMQANGTEEVVYFFYPDPIGGNFSSLKSCLDTLRPQMQALCEGLTMPKCYWLDLREVWDGHPEYTQDGIHPTPAGDQATGQAIWDVMVENCVAQ